MDKREYLNRLRMQLMDLTDEERREALEYYEEYFADAGEENEGEVILSLGTPEQVAKQIKAGFRSEEEGMFTENGYREKIESDNPPEVYGKKIRKQKDKGPLPWMRGKQKDAEYQSGFDSYSGSGSEYGSGYGKDTSGDDRENAGYRGGGYNADGQSGYGRGGQQTGKKKEGMSGGMIALLVILGILASPVVFGLGVGLIGMVIGIFGAILGVVMAFLALMIGLVAAGVAVFITGVAMLFVRPFGGMICIAVGCFLIALFLLCGVLLAVIFSKFFPWLIREVESLGKYLSRKWSERKGKGEAV